jgi:hypothetical protein
MIRLRAVLAAPRSPVRHDRRKTREHMTGEQIGYVLRRHRALTILDKFILTGTDDTKSQGSASPTRFFHGSDALLHVP